MLFPTSPSSLRPENVWDDLLFAKVGMKRLHSRAARMVKASASTWVLVVPPEGGELVAGPVLPCKV